MFDPSTSTASSKRPVVLVGERETEHTRQVLDVLYYKPNIAALEAPEDVIEENLKHLRSKKWKPGPVEAELYPGLSQKLDNAILKRHARVYAAFGQYIFQVSASTCCIRA